MKSGDVIALVFDILSVLLLLAFSAVMAFPWLLIFLGLIPAIIAMKKGRSFFTWWLYGMWLFLIALVHSLVMKTNKQNLEQAQLSDGMKKCEYCAELIKQDAKVCRFCGRELGNKATAAS